jgi:hypothetical protein
LAGEGGRSGVKVDGVGGLWLRVVAVGETTLSEMSGEAEVVGMGTSSSSNTTVCGGIITFLL